LSIDYDDGDVAVDRIMLPVAGVNREYWIPKNNEVITWQFNNLGLKYLVAPQNWTFNSGIITDGIAFHTVQY
jgi:hypothetical protein